MGTGTIPISNQFITYQTTVSFAWRFACRFAGVIPGLSFTDLRLSGPSKGRWMETNEMSVPRLEKVDDFRIHPGWLVFVGGLLTDQDFYGGISESMNGEHLWLGCVYDLTVILRRLLRSLDCGSDQRGRSWSIFKPRNQLCKWMGYCMLPQFSSVLIHFLM